MQDPLYADKEGVLCCFGLTTSGRIDMDLQNYRNMLSKKQSGLLEAVESGTLVKVHSFSDYFQNLKQDELFTYILLVSALKRKHRTISKILIKKNCSVKSSQKTKSYCTPLYYAVEMGDFEIFQALWEKGASIFDQDGNHESALELAMLKEETSMINYVLHDIRLRKSSQKLKPESEKDIALFHAACWIANLSAIEVFLSSNFSVRSRSGFNHSEWKGFTPLHFAIEGSEFPNKAISLLLEHDQVDFYAQDYRGKTCLHLVFDRYYNILFKADFIDRIKHSNESIFRQFINPVDENGLSHFHIMCSINPDAEDSKKHLDAIKCFIDRGVDVNSSVSSDDQSHPCYTALHFAIRTSSWKVQKFLLENGADPSKTNKMGRTVLHAACGYYGSKRKQRLRIVESLLHYGADPATRDTRNCTPLHDSFYSQGTGLKLDESQKLLLSKIPPGINYTDNYGLTYLHMACTGDDLTIIKILISNGAPINFCVQSVSAPYYPKYGGYSALHFAVESQQVEVVEFILSHGADANCVADEQVTPLHLACRHTNVQFYKLGSDDDEIQVDVDWLSSRESHIRIVELLIEHGATVNAKDSTGSTPLLENCSIPEILADENFRKDEILLQRMLEELFTRQKRVMDILLNHGADITVRSAERNDKDSFYDTSGCRNNAGTLLHILTKNLLECPMNEKLIKIALEKGVDVNALDQDKEITPLDQAVAVSMSGKIDTSVIRLLLDYGAKFSGKLKYAYA